MSFVSEISRVPTPFDPVRGDEVAQLFASSGPLYDLIAGTAGCSPFLYDALTREAEWIAGALEDPQAALDALARDGDAGRLRQDKRRMATLVALMDLSGQWSLSQVTRALTDFADRAVDTALTTEMAPLQARGKLPERPGLTVLAMGKMGAHELNYSSDIDLICLFDATEFAVSDAGDIRTSLIRAVRASMKRLSDVTEAGYVFRTDLRLRPDASVTPVVVSTAAAEGYYESVGRTWERAAFIKARTCAGDIAAGNRFLETLSPFIWRKHLDFAAIEDAHAIRLKIRAHKGLHGPITLPGHDMKLGRGGIREIEFFTQTRQLIAGGRDRSLRGRETQSSLQALADKDWVSQEDATALSEIYERHRMIEHRLQMVRDAQTHSLPHSEEGFERLAAFVGRDVAGLQDELVHDLSKVHRVTDSFFAPDVPVEPDASVEFGAEVTARWPGYPALRSDRASALFDRVRPMILDRLRHAADPDQALQHFDAFLAGLPAGVQVFSLFEANPQLIELLANVVAVSAPLASYLGRNAQVLDAVIGGAFFEPWAGVGPLAAELTAALEREADYETALVMARAWRQEQHFRVGVHHLQGLMDAERVGQAYSDIAEAILLALWPRVQAHFAAKHGPAPGLGAVILGMGSLGAGRLHSGSDLDLMLVYDPQGQDASDGPRPLATRPYFARLTQALITALTAPMSRGRLYEVDMRLRPSGRNGPVATSFDAFAHYQEHEAWTWEHLALTRARVIAGPKPLADAVEACRREVLSTAREKPAIATDIADMRRRLAEAKPAMSPFSAKVGAGRLQDIELFAQTLGVLSQTSPRTTPTQLKAGRDAGLIPVEMAQEFGEAAALWWSVRLASELVCPPGVTWDQLGIGAREFLLRETGQANEDSLFLTLNETSDVIARQITETLAGWASK